MGELSIPQIKPIYFTIYNFDLATCLRSAYYIGLRIPPNKQSALAFTGDQMDRLGVGLELKGDPLGLEGLQTSVLENAARKRVIGRVL